MCDAPLCSAADTAEAELKTVSGENGMQPQDVAEDIPKPSIKIDNEHDAFATIVCISYGDRLGELLDTVRLMSGTIYVAIECSACTMCFQTICSRCKHKRPFRSLTLRFLHG